MRLAVKVVLALLAGFVATLFAFRTATGRWPPPSVAIGGTVAGFVLILAVDLTAGW